ncbi:MAG: hypothetical protein NTV51_02690 [Verrucomicrobia bacterium]|nr:hypothetical protein [Verrucomicrobiota bacterium]
MDLRSHPIRAVLSLCCLLAPLLRAGPTETAIVAAMKLPDAANYSWSTHVEDDARSYNQVDAVFKGSERCVIQTEDGWKTPEEIASLARVDQPAGPGGGPGGGSSGGGFPGGPGRRGRRGPGGEPPAYSNLQLNLSRPHDEIGIIVGSHTEIHPDGDLVAGTLSETGAKLLLVHPGQNELTPLRASGTFRLWVRDGALVKYELKLDGTLAVETPNARREVEVHQRSSTEIRAVGTTRFEIPEEARKKLGG